MRSSKLYSILDQLTVYELNRFKKFIHSPYYNVNDALTQLFAALEPFLKDKSVETKLDKSELYKEITDSKKYSDVKFRKITSDLLKLVESFLALQVYEKNPLHKANYLLEAISKKRITKLYNTAINSARRLSEQQIEKSSSFYFYQYQIERNLFNLTTEFEKKAISKSSLKEFNVTDISKNLDLFFLAEKIKYYCTLLSWKNIVKHDYELIFMEEVLSQVKKMKRDHIPPLAIYYQIYLTITEPEKRKHYYQLKQLINKHIQEFPIAEAKDIYDSAFNYCISVINKGDETFSEELLEIYISALEQGALYIEGELSPTSFRNICLIALRLGKFGWTQDFIKEYSQKINPKFRKNAYTFNMARLSWYKKEYHDVISYLAEVEFNDIFLDLGSKSLLLATYYELDEYEALYSLTESFMMFLRRHKNIPETRKLNYLNLIKFIRKLTRLQISDVEALKSFHKEIREEKHLVNREWLNNKISDLLGSKVSS